MSENLIVKKETIQRLVKDVKQIIKNPLHNNGIYYLHDETDVLKGYAMIVGPPETPYENGLFFFCFTFPYDYPYSPPTLKYMTNDGKTRFNPNLYRNGKVCISILNTWRGEQWTSCQNISSILLTLITIFNNNPLLNEPGVASTCPDIPLYNRIILYKSYEISICELVLKLNNDELMSHELLFKDEIKNHLIDKYNSILDVLTELKNDNKRELMVQTSMYQMKFSLNYKNLYTRFKKINIKKLK